jgi:gliding motility-associated-like protein
MKRILVLAAFVLSGLSAFGIAGFHGIAAQEYTVRPTSENGFRRFSAAADEQVKGFSSDDSEEEYALYIPNCFTPNNDGLNDQFQVYGFGVKEYRVSIFSRWGEQLYQFDQNSRGWKNQLCDQATYVYLIEYETPAGKKLRKYGYFTIVR